MRNKGIMGHLQAALPMSKVWMNQLCTGPVSSFVCDACIPSKIMCAFVPIPDNLVSTVHQIYAVNAIPFVDTSDSFRASGIAEHHLVSDT
jgi:hypothetical protein